MMHFLLNALKALRAPAALACALIALSAGGCTTDSGTQTSETGGNTSWLTMCEQDRDCSTGSCFRGACTSECNAAADCDRFGDEATCFVSSPTENCADSGSVCLPKCSSASDCAPFGSRIECSAGVCQPSAESCAGDTDASTETEPSAATDGSDSSASSTDEVGATDGSETGTTDPITTDGAMEPGDETGSDENVDTSGGADAGSSTDADASVEPSADVPDAASDCGPLGVSVEYVFSDGPSGSTASETESTLQLNQPAGVVFSGYVEADGYMYPIEHNVLANFASLTSTAANVGSFDATLNNVSVTYRRYPAADAARGPEFVSDPEDPVSGTVDVRVAGREPGEHLCFDFTLSLGDPVLVSFSGRYNAELVGPQPGDTGGMTEPDASAGGDGMIRIPECPGEMEHCDSDRCVEGQPCVTCPDGQVCVEIDISCGPAQGVTAQCIVDPCAGETLDCSCAASVCDVAIGLNCGVYTQDNFLVGADRDAFLSCTGGGVCASPDTRIATPFGDIPIADLAAGDLVYSQDADGIVAVPLLRVVRRPVHDHSVVRLRLDDGSTLEISGPHPTADGRRLADLTPGDVLDGRVVVAHETIPYQHPFTYDILPASSSGSYVAEGVWMGSTLSQAGSE